VGVIARSFFEGEVVVRRNRAAASCEPYLVPTPPLHMLCLLAQTPITFQRFDGEAKRWRQLALKPGDINFHSAGTAGTHVGWNARERGNPEFLHVFIDPRRIVRAAAENGGHAAVDLASEKAVRHPLIAQIIRTMVETASRADAADDLLVDAAAELLAVSLARELVATGAMPTHRDRALPPRLVRLVTEYIDANLSGRVRVSDLSALTGLSSYHFSRAFKAATGQSPYAFAVGRRVLRAQQLLTTDLPLAEIALAVGFSSQSHLTEHFRRIVGVTPGRIRRDG
jgi:AraC family transcriptional regulator